MAVEQMHYLILGPHGAGITTALSLYAEFDFLTVANVDPQQLHNTITPLVQLGKPVAFSIQLSPDTDPAAVISAIQALRQNLPNLKILTLDAPEDVLITRFMDSEKKHAFESAGIDGLQAAIAAEKKLFGPIKELKDYSIDTSTTTPVELRHKIAKILGLPIENQDFTVYITTFGFKYGMPIDAELVFDMRFMTNPFYDESLRPLTGKDKPVRDFIFNLDHARTFFEKWSDLVAQMLPLYQAQGKTRLTIAVGCTGGKHRSVCMAEELAQYLQTNHPTYSIVITHREMLRWGKAPSCPVGEAS